MNAMRFRLPSRDDRGVSLLETVMALVITMMVLGPMGVFLARGIHETGENEQKQVATVLADGALEYARALPTSKLLDGRTTAAVASQIALASTKASWSEGDPRTANGPAGTALLPLSDTSQKVAGTTYMIRVFVSVCYPTADATQACTATVTSARPMYRVMASVRWKYAAGECDSGACEVLVNTLLDANPADPLFTVPA